MEVQAESTITINSISMDIHTIMVKSDAKRIEKVVHRIIITRITNIIYYFNSIGYNMNQ